MDLERLASLEATRAAELVEIFSSVQGEGPRVGERHLFVRFTHCDIHCSYCDTPLCHAIRPTWRHEMTLGMGDFQDRPNPLTPVDLRREIMARLDQMPHAAVSFTGGEPLLQPWAIADAAPSIRAAGVKTLLETDGNLDAAFASIVDHIDILSMDWKLESATGEPSQPDAHARMLSAASGMETWVKAVFVAETPFEEVLEAVKIVHDLRPNIPFVLQPCTPFAKVKQAPPSELAVVWQERLSQIHADVRVIPQVHKFLDRP